MAALSAPLEVQGKIRVPGDKSLSHRALIISSLCSGESKISGILQSADVRSTERALRQLGACIDRKRDCVHVEKPAAGHWRGGETLDCGNSGTTARLLAGLVAGAGVDATFTGDESLSRRPMRRVAAPLVAMGARVEPAPHGGLPMSVHGGILRASKWESDVASAQIKSAVLLAGCVARVRVEYAEPALSRDHTERMLAARGAALTREGARVVLDRGGDLYSADLTIPGDPSSAAFLVALASIADKGDLLIERVCLNPTRTRFLDVLRRMGARIDIDNPREESGEPVGDIHVRHAALKGTAITADEIPSLIDEIPILACVAARAEGETIITGATELRVKESDRIAAVVAGLRAIGVDAEELPDGMRVTGRANALRGSIVTHGDHRIAMSFGVLSALSRGDIVIDDAACVDVSYPSFWRDVAHVRK